jgi:hypothetical protein
MRVFIIKIIQKPWFFPLALLLIGMIAYGLILPGLGFYWDDWEGVYLYQLHDPAVSFQYYSERPLSAIAYLFLFPLAKMTPPVWQVVSLFLRWGGVLFIYSTLNLVWPSRIRQNRWIAALLFVFPGFLLQPASVAFAQHHITFLFFSASLLFTVLALKRPGAFWLWMPLSILLGGIQVFMMEYFVGLEIIRPFLIWFALQPGAKKRGLFWKTSLYWMPFLLVLVAYFYWRLVYLPPTLGVDPNTPVLLQLILTSPWDGLSTLFVTAYQDILHLLLYIWPKAFLDPEIMEFGTRRVWAAWLCGAVACIAYGFYNNRHPAEEVDSKISSRQLLVLGIVSLLFGSAPVWAAGRQITGGMWSERFALAPMLGAVVLIVTLVDWLFRTHGQKQVLLALLLGISISGQLTNQIIFRDDWENQRDIYWQLHWRIPSLEPGTALFGKGTFTEKSSYYDGIYIVNILFEAAPRQDASYGYFDIFHTFFDDYQPGLPLAQTFRGIQFSGNTSQAVVFDFGVRGGCVRVLDFIYEGDPDLNASVAELFDISDVSNIKTTPEVTPPVDIFGTEPPHTWCYYFEKADLARQLQDWETILQLKAESDSHGFAPDLGAEYLPFIEAYACTGQWEQAYLLSVSASQIGDGPGTALCNAWQGFTRLGSGEDAATYIESAALDFCVTGDH